MKFKYFFPLNRQNTQKWYKFSTPSFPRDPLTESLRPQRVHMSDTLNNILMIFELSLLWCFSFIENMQDDESYIYLPALNALSVAGEIRTDKVLNLLTDKFMMIPDNEMDTTKHQIGLLKIGEVIVKISKILGRYFFINILYSCWCMYVNS